MQTFLPYKDFKKSAEVLDKRRCWKQVVEASQIISCLEGNGSLRWKNHPAVKMWEGHINELKYYHNCFLNVCLVKHKINTQMKFYYIQALDKNGNIIHVKLDDSLDFYKFPWWLGNESFHRAMRAKLIEKYPEHYTKIFEKNDIDFNNNRYIWPSQKGFFKILS